MHLGQLQIENFRLFGSGQQSLTLAFNRGLNALVGENDSGKTAIIDALRIALGTSSQDSYRVEDADFHVTEGKPTEMFSICCRFDELTEAEGGAFIEHITWESAAAKLYVTYKARRVHRNSRHWIDIEVRTGKNGNGNRVEGAVRNFLRSTYLRALRDADRELSAGRNSRLSQILQYTEEIRSSRDDSFDAATFVKEVAEGKKPTFPKDLVSVGMLAEYLIANNDGVKNARTRLDVSYLANLALGPDQLSSCISVSNPTAPDIRLRQILEKLELCLLHPKHNIPGIRRGLGYNNLLFMACELLLLGNDENQLPLLLVEEPEAHLHPQLQLRLIDFLQSQAQDSTHPVQVIMTTHSPNLASRLKLDNLMLVADGRVFPLGRGHTQLSEQDYLFLERFLDVTKANLFFARGIIIVEGDAEYILLPTIAKLIGRDLAKYGVSIINAKSVGLKRYSKIFRRKNSPDSSIPIPIACLADLDRDISPQPIRKTETQAPSSTASAPASIPVPAEEPALETARTEATPETAEPPTADHCDATAREANTKESIAEAKRKSLQANDGENVRTFVSDYRTLETSLSMSGLSLELLIAVELAEDEFKIEDAERKARINEIRTGKARKNTKERPSREELILQGKNCHKTLVENGKSAEEITDVIYARIGEKLKTITAQHLASVLNERIDKKLLSTEELQAMAEELRARIPKYIQSALEYVTEPFSAHKPEENP